jgi:hypothetical protein
VSAANQISQIGTVAPSQLGLAEKNQKSIKLACRFFVFALPHSRRECLPCSFLYIRVHPGNQWFYIILFCGTM